MTRHTSRDARAGRDLPLLLVLIATTLPSTADAAFGEPGGIPWRADLGTAQVEAKDRDAVLWLQFTGPWCPNCRRMDRGAFVHATVVNLAVEKFVPIKLRSDEFEGLAVSLGLTVLPSTVLVRPNGEVLAKHEGYADPTEFYAFLQDSLIKEGRIGPKREAAVAARPVAPEASKIALASYCPVSLVNAHKLVAGKPEIALRYGDKEYRFAGPEEREQFLSRPERFVPVNEGASPVCQVDGGQCRPGDPRYGVTYKGRLFLCADVHERDLFLLNPERYAQVGAADRAKLGDRRGLWALTRPARNTAPTFPKLPAQGESTWLQALKAPLDFRIR